MRNGDRRLGEFFPPVLLAIKYINHWINPMVYIVEADTAADTKAAEDPDRFPFSFAEYLMLRVHFFLGK
jgi:hypothetical protein